MTPLLTLALAILLPSQQVAAPPGPVALEARLLDEAGKPLDGSMVRMHAQLGEEVLGAFQTVGENGAVRLDIPEGYRRLVCTRFSVAPVEGLGEIGDWSRALTVDVPKEQEGRVLDLGELKLSSAPVLFQGKVVNDLGEPIPGATVTVDAAKFVTSDPEVPLMETLQLQQMTDEEGSFLIRGRAGHSKEEGALHLSVEAAGCLPAEGAPYPPGETPLELRLERGGSMTVSWVLPTELENHIVHVVLEREAAEGAEADEPLVRPSFRPELELPAVLPGTYRISLQDDFENELRAIEGVQVEAGEPCMDGRIQGIDLVELVRVQTFTLVTEQGQALPVPPTVWLPPDRPVRPRRVGRAVDRKTWRMLVAREAPVTVLAIANGFRPKLVSRATEDMVVEMQPSLTIQLKILDAPELKRDGRYLGLAMVGYPEPVDKSIFRPGYSVVVEGAGPVNSRDLTAHLPGPGQYLVRWAVYETSEQNRPVLIGRIDGDLLDIPDSLGLQTFETPMPPEVWTIQPAEPEQKPQGGSRGSSGDDAKEG